VAVWQLGNTELRSSIDVIPLTLRTRIATTAMANTELTLQAQIWCALMIVSIAASIDHMSRKSLDYSPPSKAPNGACRVLKLVEAVALIAANRFTWQSV